MWPSFILLACAFFSTSSVLSSQSCNVITAASYLQDVLITMSWKFQAAHSLLFHISDILYDTWNYVCFTHQCSMTSEKHLLHELTSSLFRPTNEQINKIMLSAILAGWEEGRKHILDRETRHHSRQVLPNPCWLSELFQLEGAFTWIFLVSNSFFRLFQHCTRRQTVQSSCFFFEVARAVCSGFPLNPSSCL